MVREVERKPKKIPMPAETKPNHAADDTPIFLPHEGHLIIVIGPIENFRKKEKLAF